MTPPFDSALLVGELRGTELAGDPPPTNVQLKQLLASRQQLLKGERCQVFCREYLDGERSFLGQRRLWRDSVAVRATYFVGAGGR